MVIMLIVKRKIRNEVSSSVIARIRETLNDYMATGMKNVANSDDCSRYSLNPFVKMFNCSLDKYCDT